MQNEALFCVCSSDTVVPHEQPKEKDMSTRVLIPNGCNMDNMLKIEDLNTLPDCFLLTDRVINGQDGAILILISPRAYLLALGDKVSNWPWWFIPVDKCSPLVTMFDEEGLHLSYG